MFRMYWNNIRQQPRFTNLYTRFGGRPAWVWGLALLIGLVPFVILITLLGILAFLVTATIYLLLAIVDEIFNRIRSVFGQSPPPADDESFDDPYDGRQNVRVISPPPSE